MSESSNSHLIGTIEQTTIDNRESQITIPGGADNGDITPGRAGRRACCDLLVLGNVDFAQPKAREILGGSDRITENCLTMAAVSHRFIATCVFFFGTAILPQFRTESAQAIPAVRGIVSDFRNHPIVIIGEAHWLKEAGDFYIHLVRDPEFQQSVQDIVVEFASRNNQPLLDRYISGEDIPIQDVRRIWRDTTKVASWESPVYAQWLAAIREVNRGLPTSRRLRVLAGDTPINWSRIHNHLDWVALGDNNISFADVIIEQVLRKNHRALVVLGTNHVTKSGDRDGGENTTTRVESRYPGSTHVVLLIYHRTLNSASQEFVRLADQSPPVLFELTGRLSTLAEQDGSPIIKKADALLYLGAPDSLQMALPPRGSLEDAYLTEVDRRSMIEWGELRARKFLGPAAQ